MKSPLLWQSNNHLCNPKTFHLKSILHEPRVGNRPGRKCVSSLSEYSHRADGNISQALKLVSSLCCYLAGAIARLWNVSILPVRVIEANAMTVFFQEPRDKLLSESTNILGAQFVNYRWENSERRLQITWLHSRLTMLPVPSAFPMYHWAFTKAGDAAQAGTA